MSQGRLRYHTVAGPNFDPFTTSTDVTVQKFIRDHFDVITTYTPNPGNGMLPWMPSSLVYRDSYAIYTDPSLFPNSTSNANLIARDVNGNKLFIPWGPKPFTQYAGDVSDPNFISYMISLLKSTLKVNNSNNYRGIWFDDVNFIPRISDANGNQVMPVDPATKKTMTLSAYLNYFASYLEQVQNALPDDTDIVHNSIWYSPAGSAVDKQIASCDYVNREGGFSDGGITGGSGQYSLSQLMKFIDHVHNLNSSVIIDEMDVANLNYAVACYLLISDGSDMIGFRNQLPNSTWPSLLSINLGLVKSSRVNIQGLWSRSFQKGIVFVNEPDASPVTIPLQSIMTDVAGNKYSSVTLGPKSGIVLYD